MLVSYKLCKERRENLFYLFKSASASDLGIKGIES